MLFAHDTESALRTAAALINSERGSPTGGERLVDPPSLAGYLDEWEMTGRRTGDRVELTEVLALRAELAEMWQAGTDDVVALVNRLLRDGQAMPQLVRHDRYDYHVHATEQDAPLAHRIAVEVAMAVADLVRVGELNRLTRCAATDCGAALVDLTKNHSRRFCDATCANRVHAAAYRARKAAR